MQAVLTVEAVKAAEQSWARNNDGETWPLMLKAGQAVARHARRHWPSARRILVVAGRGNNGGDGYIAASELMAAGLDVAVLAPAGMPAPDTDAERALNVFRQANGALLDDLHSNWDLIIDAALGTGHRGALREPWPQLFEQLRSLQIPVLAVDLPSGLNASTGEADSAAMTAQRTLTFIAFKAGLLTHQGPGLTGQISLDRLAIDSANQALGHFLDEPPSWPERRSDAHKGAFGQVAIIAGAPGFGGSGLLAARAALAAGAGRVVWHCDASMAGSILAAQPELMTAAPTEPAKGTLVLGPGLGFSAQADSLYRQYLAGEGGGILDADGLTWLAQQSGDWSLPTWVLTPHPGEAGRLLGCSSADIQADRCQAALALSERYQAVVVLKGAGSVVAWDGQLRFVHPGTVAMATPGMGDTLAGLIAALMAQGQSPWQAAQTGAWWHAYLAWQLAQSRRVVLASDVIEVIAQADQFSG
ncbi:NAD(P)H-hydrate dehydratase [Saccharospirillum sp. HFRX-1]|uniref:NAD(P)H-hydrate dehydratase n=1 Tax=unclassified Saccharospirillum TaxID=2633430 RepID=UPI0037142790